jgi:hypothetical protein
MDKSNWSDRKRGKNKALDQLEYFRVDQVVQRILTDLKILKNEDEYEELEQYVTDEFGVTVEIAKQYIDKGIEKARRLLKKNTKHTLVDAIEAKKAIIYKARIAFHEKPNPKYLNEERVACRELDMMCGHYIEKSDMTSDGKALNAETIVVIPELPAHIVKSMPEFALDQTDLPGDENKELLEPASNDEG